MSKFLIEWANRILLDNKQKTAYGIFTVMKKRFLTKMIPALTIGLLITATEINRISAEPAHSKTTQSLSIQHDKISKNRYGLIRSPMAI